MLIPKLTVRITSVFILVCISLINCTPDVTTVQVVRHPLIKFDFNGNATWQSTNYSFGNIARVVVYPQDTTQPGQLFNRLELTANGSDNNGNTLQFILDFDASDLTQLAGVYKTVHTNQRGLASVQVFNLSNQSSLAAFDLCSGSITEATLQIQKQSLDEQLITGVFSMTLCDSRDSTKQIDIVNGTLTDIHY